MDKHALALLLIIIFLIAILYALGSGLYYLSKDRGQDKTRLVKALSWRIGLSLLLFLLLFVMFALGWIKPHSLM